LGEPEAAAEILRQHVEDVERHGVTPFYVWYYVYRLDWVLAAAQKFERDEASMWRRPRG
jgi:hypothetical protein